MGCNERTFTSNEINIWCRSRVTVHWNINWDIDLYCKVNGSSQTRAFVEEKKNNLQFDRSWWRLFQKHVLLTKFDINILCIYVVTTDIL